MAFRLARPGQGGASRGELLSGLLLGALFGFLQMLEAGSVLSRLPAPSQLRYVAFTWCSYAALGWLAAWLCRRAWAAAAALAAGVWLEIVTRGGAPASLPRHAAALLAAGLVFLAASRAARRLPALQAPKLWAAANLAAFLLLGFRFWASPAEASGAAGAHRPNVLLITIDTLRADHVGCYGSRTARTPAMDALAREGVVVETAISPIPLTGPSHTTLLTGLYPARHGVTLNQPIPLKAGVRTLPEILASQGYATAAFVSGITLKDQVSTLPERFQLYDADFSRIPFVPELLLSNSLARLALRETGQPSGWFERKAERTVEAASRWLRSRGDGGEPFFLWVHLYDPHGPYTPPPPFDRVDGSLDGGRTHGDWYGVPVEERGEILADPRELRVLRALYAGEVSYADQQVGRLLATLRSLGLMERTLTVLTSDHGESLTEHGYYFDHSVALYEPDLRVPLLLRLPGRKWAGSRIQRLAGLTDVTPTVLDLLGLPIPRRLDGSPLLRDLATAAKAGPAPVPAVVSAVFQGEIAGAKKLLALRTREHKYIRVSPWWGDHLLIPGREELYDLVRDPGEEHDLAAREPALLSRYRALAEPYWRGWLVPTRAGERSREGEKELRALGYLQ
jgi:arylsulfatase A-like enzyme